MRRLITIFYAFCISAASAQNCLKLDIMLVGDCSASVSGREDFINAAFSGFVDRFELSEEGIKIGVVYFNDLAAVMCPLTADKSLVKMSTGVPSVRGTTNVMDALDKCLGEFNAHGRPGYGKMIILVSDGDVDDPDDAIAMASMIRASGATICGVMIVDSRSKEEQMRGLSSDFCYVESNYENLVIELKKMDICL